jgi:hypothetical protein
MAFAKQTPVVFLNACEVGQQTLALGGPAGFVPTFIKLFASSAVSNKAHATSGRNAAGSFYRRAAMPLHPTRL